MSTDIRAAPVGAISYMDIDGEKYKRDVLFCYDLKLSEDFVPKNQGKFYLNLCSYAKLIIYPHYSYLFSIIDR